MTAKASQTAAPAPTAKAAPRDPGASRVERSEAPRVPVTDPERAAYEYVLRDPGRSLDVLDRSFFEERFGRSLPDVRVHRGAEAEALSAGLGALAWNAGLHVVLGRAMPSLRSEEGRGVLAHELVHVLQHEATGRPMGALPVGAEATDGAAEQQAHRVASMVVTGSGAVRALAPVTRGASIARFVHDEPVRVPRARLRAPVHHGAPEPAAETARAPTPATPMGTVVSSLIGVLDIPTRHELGDRVEYVGGGGELVVRGGQLTLTLHGCTFVVNAAGDRSDCPVFQRVTGAPDRFASRLPPALRASVEAAAALVRARVPLAAANEMLRLGWGRGARSLVDSSVGDTVADVATTIHEYELRVAHLGDGSGSTFAFTGDTVQRVIAAVLRAIFQRAHGPGQTRRLASLFASALSNTRNHRIARMLSDGTLDPSALLLLGAAGQERSAGANVRVFQRYRSELRHAVQGVEREGIARALPAATLVRLHLNSIKRRIDQSRLRAVAMGDDALHADLRRLDEIVRGVLTGAYDFAEARDVIPHDFGEATRVSQAPATFNTTDEASRDSRDAFVAMARTVAEIFDALAPHLRLATSRNDALRRARTWADGAHGRRLVAVYDLSIDARSEARGHVLVRLAPSEGGALEAERALSGALVAVLGEGVLRDSAGGVVAEAETPWMRAMGWPADHALSDDEASQVTRRFAEVMSRMATARIDRMLDVYLRLEVARGWALQLLVCHREGGVDAVARAVQEVAGLPASAALGVAQAVDEFVWSPQPAGAAQQPRSGWDAIAPAREDADQAPRLFADESRWAGAPEQTRLRTVLQAMSESEALRSFMAAVIANTTRLEELQVNLGLRTSSSRVYRATEFRLEGEERSEVFRSPDATLVGRLWWMFPGLHGEFLNDLAPGLDREHALDPSGAGNALERAFVVALRSAPQSAPELAEHVLDGWLSGRIATLEESEALSSEEIALRFEGAAQVSPESVRAALVLPDEQVGLAALRMQGDLSVQIHRLERLRGLVLDETAGRFGAALGAVTEALRRALAGVIDFRAAREEVERANVSVRALAGEAPGSDGATAVRRSLDGLLCHLLALEPTLRFAADPAAAMNTARIESEHHRGTIGVYRVRASGPDAGGHVLVRFSPAEWGSYEHGPGGSLIAIAERAWLLEPSRTPQGTRLGVHEELIRALAQPRDGGTDAPARARLHEIFAESMEAVARREATNALHALDRCAGDYLAPTLVSAHRHGGPRAVSALLNQRSNLGPLYAGTILPDAVARAAQRLDEIAAMAPLEARLHADEPLDGLRAFHSYQIVRTSIDDARHGLEQQVEVPSRESTARARMADLWDTWTILRPSFLDALHLQLPTGATFDRAPTHNFAEEVFRQGLLDERAENERTQQAITFGIMGLSFALTALTGGALAGPILLGLNLIIQGSELRDAILEAGRAESRRVAGLTDADTARSAHTRVDSAAFNLVTTLLTAAVPRFAGLRLENDARIGAFARSADLTARVSAEAQSLARRRELLAEMLQDALIDVGTTVLDPAMQGASGGELAEQGASALMFSVVGNAAGRSGEHMHGMGREFVLGPVANLRLEWSYDGHARLYDGDVLRYDGRTAQVRDDGVIVIRRSDGTFCEVQPRRGGHGHGGGGARPQHGGGAAPGAHARVPVAPDTNLRGRATDVQFESGAGGTIQALRIGHGPDATRIDIEAHQHAAERLRASQGISGLLYQGLSWFQRALSVVARVPPEEASQRLLAPVGSEPWAAFHEVAKHMELIEAEQRAFEHASGDQQRAIAERLAFLEGELSRHARVLHEWDMWMRVDRIQAGDEPAEGDREGQHVNAIASLAGEAHRADIQAVVRELHPSEARVMEAHLDNWRHLVRYGHLDGTRLRTFLRHLFGTLGGVPLVDIHAHLAGSVGVPDVMRALLARAGVLQLPSVGAARRNAGLDDIRRVEVLVMGFLNRPEILSQVDSNFMASMTRLFSELKKSTGDYAEIERASIDLEGRWAGLASRLNLPFFEHYRLYANALSGSDGWTGALVAALTSRRTLTNDVVVLRGLPDAPNGRRGMGGLYPAPGSATDSGELAENFGSYRLGELSAGAERYRLLTGQRALIVRNAYRVETYNLRQLRGELLLRFGDPTTRHQVVVDALRAVGLSDLDAADAAALARTMLEHAVSEPFNAGRVPELRLRSDAVVTGTADEVADAQVTSMVGRTRLFTDFRRALETEIRRRGHAIEAHHLPTTIHVGEQFGRLIAGESSRMSLADLLGEVQLAMDLGVERLGHAAVLALRLFDPPESTSPNLRLLHRIGFEGPQSRASLPASAQASVPDGTTDQFIYRTLSDSSVEVIGLSGALGDRLSLRALHDRILDAFRDARVNRHIVEGNLSSTSQVNSMPFDEVPMIHAIAETLAVGATDLRIAFGSDDSAIFGASLRGDLAALLETGLVPEYVVFAAIFRSHSIFSSTAVRRQLTPALLTAVSSRRAQLVEAAIGAVQAPADRERMIALLRREFPEVPQPIPSVADDVGFRQTLQRYAERAIVASP